MTYILIVDTDQDSSMFHPLSGEKLTTACDDTFWFEFSKKDLDKILGYLLSNAFQLDDKVFNTLYHGLELEDFKLEEGYIYSGNYSLFLTDKKVNRL